MLFLDMESNLTAAYTITDSGEALQSRDLVSPSGLPSTPGYRLYYCAQSKDLPAAIRNEDWKSNVLQVGVRFATLDTLPSAIVD